MQCVVFFTWSTDILYYGETWPRSSPSFNKAIRHTLAGIGTLKDIWTAYDVCYSELLQGCLWPSNIIKYWERQLKCRLIVNKLLASFTRIALASDAPWSSGTCKPVCLNHVRVTTLEWLDQGHLDPSVKQRKKYMFLPGFEPSIPCTAGERCSKVLSRELILISIQNLYST